MPLPDSWTGMVLVLFLAFGGSLLPAFLFQFGGKNWFFVGLSGTLGWGIFLTAHAGGASSFTALFLAAFTVALYGELMKILLKTHSPAFTVGGIFPLVPGYSAFQTLELTLKHQTARALDQGLETLGAALAIALGILTVSGLWTFGRRWMKR